MNLSHRIAFTMNSARKLSGDVKTFKKSECSEREVLQAERRKGKIETSRRKWGQVKEKFMCNLIEKFTLELVAT